MLNKYIIFFHLILLFSCSKVAKHAEVEPTCIAGQSACFVDMADMRIFVKFNREVLLAETPFTLTVYANKKQNIKNISGFMEGDNMYMGKVPLLFAKNGEHQFNAQGFIGSCGKQDMQWRIWITFIEQSDKSHTFSITVPSYLR